MLKIFFKLKSYLLIFVFVIFSINSFTLFHDDISSDKFITRWQFQNLANFIYDPSTKAIQAPTDINGMTFDPELVKEKDIILVRHVKKFFKLVHPKIKNKYIIITHGNYQDTFHPEYIKYLDDSKVIAWFGIHAGIKSHPKFHPIPIGVWQNKTIDKNSQNINQLLKTLRNTPKTKLLYNNFTIGMHKERDIAVNILKRKKLYIEVPHRDFIEYMTEMAQYKFTSSPRGMGIDCYRTWEALLVGSIPIVKSSELNPLYKNLPVLVINNWEEIDKTMLKSKYKDITKQRYSLEKLYIDYWDSKIKEVQTNN